MMGSSEPPAGTIALLFTDIEGSTLLAARLGASWPGVLEDHHAVVTAAIAAEGGFVDGTEGDAFFATFADPASGARAAVAALRGLRTHPWPEEMDELRVRMGLHVGYVERARTGYVGLEVHRAARVAAAAHGGQLLLTAVARELIGDVVPTESVGVHRLKDFPSAVQLFCAVVDGRGAGAFPPPRTQEVRPTNLPAGARTLVGRQDELDQVCAALLDEGERMVTLTGRGGAGKTSLGILAGARLLADHPGGVWLANLATVVLPGDVAGAVAAAVGAERDVASSPLQAIETRLRSSGATLLIVDNMEHLLSAADVLSELLDALPELRLLITSQAPLRAAAERVIVLDALDDEAALTLIARVASRRGARVSIAEEDREALLDVVHLLDGLPLALELAAARLSLLTAVQLRDRLRDSPDLLRDSGGDRPARQRSLRATVEWTLGLLAEPVHGLFVRMGAFAGPVELEDLEAVTGRDGLDVIDALAGLLDVALVRRVESGDGRVRFGLPEALRQISSDLLDSEPDGQAWRQAHARRQYELVWPARTTFTDGPSFRSANAADAEVAAALRWATTQQDPVAGPIAAARASLLANTGRLREAMAVLGPLIESPPTDPAVHSLALVAYAQTLMGAGRSREALPIADHAVRIADDPVSKCLALTDRGLVLLFGGQPAEALLDHVQATVVARDLGPAMLSGALVLEAQALMATSALDEAAGRLAEAKRVGAPVEASALRYLDTLEGDLAMAFGRPGDALEPYARSLERAHARNDALQVLFDLRGLANALATLERDDDALQVTGLAEIQGQEVGGPGASAAEHLQGNGPVAEAELRLGVARAADLKSRGNAASAGYRVARACQLARIHQLA
jgi:predicted ATPase/class 3 adenylate cyclase